MNSRSTGTSPLSPDEWHRLLERIPAAVAAVDGDHSDVTCVFVESSRYARHQFRQTVGGRTPGPPEVSDTIRYVEGASATAYDGASVRLATVEDVDDVSPHGRPAGALPVDAGPLLKPWEAALPQPLIHESLRSVAEALFGLSSAVVSVSVEIATDARRIIVSESGGLYATRCHDHVRLRARCRLNGGREIRAVRGGSGADPLSAVGDFRSLVADVRAQIEAKPMRIERAGCEVQVVFEAGWSAGSWLHEVVGHYLEADNVARGPSPFAPVGRRVASPFVSVTDDPTVRWGAATMQFDDEGVRAARKVLVEGGIVAGHLDSRQSAAARGVRSSGNGRRQNYRCVPIPRMTNLMLQEGPHRPSDIVESVADGLLVTVPGYGEVDVGTGVFSLDVLLAQPISGGRPGEPVYGLTLTGDVGRSLDGVAAAGNDVVLDSARGDCLKHGQAVRVGLGAPTILVEGLTVHSSRDALTHDSS